MPIQGILEEDPFQVFSQRHSLPFSSLYMLRRAMTHSSYLNEHQDVTEDNERLEFLGDAVLDFLVAAWLYDHFPEFNEGQMTRCRAALVGNDQLAEFARQLDLGALMLLGRGEQDGGGRNRSALLGSTFEALVGSIYHDQGIVFVRGFVEPFLDSVMVQILAERKDLDSKSMLQEWSQSQGLGAPKYVVLKTQGPDHAKNFLVEVQINGVAYGLGEGPSKQAGSKAAATQALKQLGLL